MTTDKNDKWPKRILIVDDHPLVRVGLSMRISLETDLRVCGEATSEEEALRLLKELQPDLAIVDITLKSGNGIELVKQISERHVSTKVLVLSGFDESLYGERALRAGALGYLNKQESNEKLIDAIRMVLRGQRFVSPSLAQRLFSAALGEAPESSGPTACLTNRELQIFRMIGQGLTSGAIANHLLLSSHTIDTHRENIKRKMGIPNAGALTRAAVQWVLENG